MNELGLKICDQKLKQDHASSTYLALFVSLFRGIQCWMTFRFDLAWIVSSIMSEPRNYLIWNLVPNHSAIKISRHFNQGRFNRPPSRLACKMSFRRQWRQCRQEGEWWLFEIPARERRERGKNVIGGRMKASECGPAGGDSGAWDGARHQNALDMGNLGTLWNV